MKSVIVVGGGVIGMLSALELQRNGLDVCVLDRQGFGQESSWAGGGIISPLYPWRYPEPISALSRVSQQLYPTLIGELMQATGIDPEFEHSGMLVLGDYQQENPESWASGLGIDMQRVDRSQIEQLEPGASARYQQGYWFPQIHQTRNPRLVKLLHAYLQQHTPVKLLENHAVSSIKTGQGRVTGVELSDRRFLPADTVVIAGGAWSGELLRNFPLAVDICPIKGQMLLIKAEPGVVRRITLSEDRYLIPRRDGRVLVGSTTEQRGFDKSTDPGVRESFWNYALNTIPALGRYPVEHHWSGLRPASSSGLPVIAPHPELAGLFINAGHYRNGLVMAPASAALLGQLVTGQAPCLDPQPYSIANQRVANNTHCDRLSAQL